MKRLRFLKILFSGKQTRNSTEKTPVMVGEICDELESSYLKWLRESKGKLEMSTCLIKRCELKRELEEIEDEFREYCESKERDKRESRKNTIEYRSIMTVLWLINGAILTSTGYKIWQALCNEGDTSREEDPSQHSIQKLQ